MDQRCSVWRQKLIGDAKQVRYKQEIYRKFIYKQEQVSNSCRETIAADIPRTWSSETIVGREVIQELLIEYATMQQGDTYLQGFSYLMTVLWTVFRTTEHARADTFWCFSRLVGLVRPLMPDFNTNWFHWYRNHWLGEFQTRLAGRRPVIADILSSDIEIFSSLITVKWFMLWFAQAVDFSEIFLLWDFLVQVPPRQLMRVYTLLAIEIIAEAATNLTYQCSGNPTLIAHKLLDLRITGIEKIVQLVQTKL